MPTASLARESEIAAGMRASDSSTAITRTSLSGAMAKMSNSLEEHDYKQMTGRGENTCCKYCEGQPSTKLIHVAGYYLRSVANGLFAVSRSPSPVILSWDFVDSAFIEQLCRLSHEIVKRGIRFQHHDNQSDSRNVAVSQERGGR